MGYTMKSINLYFFHGKFSGCNYFVLQTIKTIHTNAVSISIYMFPH